MTTLARSSGPVSASPKLPLPPAVKVLLFIASLAASVAVMWWWLGARVSIVLNASVLLHEVGHFAVFLYYGLRPGMLFIPVLGAVTYASNETDKMNQFAKAVLALVGPGINLALVMVGLGMTLVPSLVSTGLLIASVNASLAAFNLLPLWITDGAHAAKAIFTSADETGDRNISRWIGLAAAALAVVMVVSGKVSFLPLILVWSITRASREDNPEDWRLPDSMNQSLSLRVGFIYGVMLIASIVATAFMPSWLAFR
jgi:Zn-dependent protease